MIHHQTSPTISHQPYHDATTRHKHHQRYQQQTETNTNTNSTIGCDVVYDWLLMTLMLMLLLIQRMQQTVMSSLKRKRSESSSQETPEEQTSNNKSTKVKKHSQQSDVKQQTKDREEDKSTGTAAGDDSTVAGTSTTQTGDIAGALPQASVDAALAYLSEWDQSHDTWKFKKVQQLHLLKMLYDSDQVSSCCLVIAISMIISHQLYIYAHCDEQGFFPNHTPYQRTPRCDVCEYSSPNRNFEYVYVTWQECKVLFARYVLSHFVCRLHLVSVL